MADRKVQKEKRRNEILLAGLKLFVRKGYSATKISDIANMVGMSTGLMFHYFESKEKLYEELIKIGISGPMGIVSKEYEDPITFFEESARTIFDSLKSEPIMAEMFVFMGQTGYNEAAPQSIKNLLVGLDVFTPTIALIEKGQKNNTIKEGNPKALAVAFWCAVQGIAEEMAIYPDMPCPDSSWIVDIVRNHQK